MSGWGSSNATSYGFSTDNALAWMADIACRDEDPELFFPIGTSGPALRQAEQAKAICDRCPVIRDCDSWTAASTDGVSAGRTEGERRALHKRRNLRQAAVA